MTEFIRVLTPQWMEFTEKRIVTSASRWLMALQEFSCPLLFETGLELETKTLSCTYSAANRKVC